MSTDYRQRLRLSTDFLKLFFGFAENLVLTGLTHSADSELLFREFVLESVGASTADDARATRDWERASATEVREGDVVELVDHVFSFHRWKSIWKIVGGQQIFSEKNRKKIAENPWQPPTFMRRLPPTPRAKVPPVKSSVKDFFELFLGSQTMATIYKQRFLRRNRCFYSSITIIPAIIIQAIITKSIIILFFFFI